MALLDRVLRRAPRTADVVEEQRMSVIEQLEALRRALIISLVAWAITTVGSFVCAKSGFFDRNSADVIR